MALFMGAAHPSDSVLWWQGFSRCCTGQATPLDPVVVFPSCVTPDVQEIFYAAEEKGVFDPLDDKVKAARTKGLKAKEADPLSGANEAAIQKEATKLLKAWFLSVFPTKNTPGAAASELSAMSQADLTTGVFIERFQLLCIRAGLTNDDGNVLDAQRHALLQKLHREVRENIEGVASISTFEEAKAAALAAEDKLRILLLTSPPAVNAIVPTKVYSGNGRQVARPGKAKEKHGHQASKHSKQPAAELGLCKFCFATGHSIDECHTRERIKKREAALKGDSGINALDSTLDGSVNDVCVSLFVDSGSQVTAMAESFRAKHPKLMAAVLSTPSCSLMSANKSQLKVIGETVVSIRIGNICKSQRVFVVESLSHDVIVGRDGIVNLGITIDGVSQSISVNGSSDDTCHPQRASSASIAVVAMNRTASSARGQFSSLGATAIRGNTNAPEPLSQTVAPAQSVDPLAVGFVPVSRHARDIGSSSERIEKVLALVTFGGITPDFNAGQLQRVRDLVAHYADVFHLPDEQLSTVRLPPIHIDTTTHPLPPMLCGPRRTTDEKEAVVEKEVAAGLKSGRYRWSSSHICSPVHVVTKDGPPGLPAKHRMTIDIARINPFIVQDPFPAPDISRIFTKIRNNIWRLTILDACNAFQQLLLDEASIYLTSFITHLGQLESTSVIFGMNVSPAVFNRAMATIFNGCPELIRYIDDMLDALPDFDTGIERLNKQLQTCRNFNLKLNPSKVKIFMESVEFLGQIVSANGIELAPKKVDDILRFRRIETKAEVQSFLGFCNAVGKYIPHLATALHPISERRRDGHDHGWTEEQERCLRWMEKQLRSPTVLHVWDRSLPLPDRSEIHRPY